MQLALGAVTVMALLMTVAMGIVTWRLVREERRRSAARLAVLASRLREHEEPGTGPVRPTPDDRDRRETSLLDEPGRDGTVSSSNPWGIGLGLAVCGLAAIVVVTLLPVGSTEDAAAAPVPLELLALGHDRRDGTLAITGTVRNPPNGAPQMRLTVLATAFDDAGTVIATERALVSAGALPAGAACTFSLSLPAEAATRYRISFMVDEGTVPHLDRRVAHAISADHLAPVSEPQETRS